MRGAGETFKHENIVFLYLIILYKFTVLI